MLAQGFEGKIVFHQQGVRDAAIGQHARLAECEAQLVGQVLVQRGDDGHVAGQLAVPEFVLMRRQELVDPGRAGRRLPFLAEDGVIGHGLGDVDLRHGAQASLRRGREDGRGDLGGIDHHGLAVGRRRQELQGRAVADLDPRFVLARGAIEELLDLGVDEIVVALPSQQLHVPRGIVGDRAVAEASEHVAGDQESGVVAARRFAQAAMELGHRVSAEASATPSRTAHRAGVEARPCRSRSSGTSPAPPPSAATSSR